MKKIVLILAVAGAVAAWPASSGAATYKGVVVGKESKALLVASPSGIVRAVAGHATVGARVVVIRGRVRVVGHVRSARLHGVVVRHGASTLFLASNRHLLAVQAAAGAANDVKPGDVVTTRVDIDDEELVENEIEIEDRPAASTQVQALVTAVAPGSVTVTVSGKPLTIELPAGLTLPNSLVGQIVTLHVRFDEPADDDDQNEDQADDDDAAATSPTTTTTVVVTGDDHGGNRGRDGGGDDNGGHGGDDGGGHH